MATKIILMRHAECEGNIQNRLAGLTNFDITKKGIMQIENIARKLKNEKIDIIYSSPLIRAVKTAKGIANFLNISNVFIKKDLREIYYGKCDGMSWEDINREYPSVKRLWKEINNYPVGMPKQEEYIHVQRRMNNIIRNICEQNKENTICIISHGIAIQAFLCSYYNKEIFKANEVLQLKNTEYIKILIDI